MGIGSPGTAIRRGDFHAADPELDERTADGSLQLRICQVSHDAGYQEKRVGAH